MLGCEIGFSELLRAGEIDAMPRIFAAQPANCGPIAAAFLAGSDDAVATVIGPTIAEGTAIAQPIRLAEVLGTLRETRGGAVMLSEDGDRRGHARSRAHRHLCRADRRRRRPRRSRKLLAAGTITPEQTTVLVLTGSGLKATPRIAELLGTLLPVRRRPVGPIPASPCWAFPSSATASPRSPPRPTFAARTLIGGDAMVADARSAAPHMLGELPGFVADMDAAGAWEPVPDPAGDGRTERAGGAGVLRPHDDGMGGTVCATPARSTASIACCTAPA